MIKSFKKPENNNNNSLVSLKSNNEFKSSIYNDSMESNTIDYKLTFNSAVIRSDRFTDKDDNYNSSSLERILENDYIRDSHGNKIKPAYNNTDEVIEALNILENLYSKFEGFKYYNQNLYYESYRYDSIQNDGCCPTSFAMIATYLLGYDVLPTEVIEAFYPYCYDSGTDVSGNCFPDVASQYGLESKCLDLNDSDAIREELEKGNPIILNVGEGEFTSSGHFIVVLGFDEYGRVIVADPYSVYNSTKTYDFDELFNQAKRVESAVWSFEKKN